MAKNNRSPIEILSRAHPWEENNNKIWLSSVINFRRNIEKFNFPGKLNTERQKAIVALVNSELEKINALDSPILFQAEEIDPLDKEYINEHYLSMESYQKAHSGEAFHIDKSATFLAILNMDDHIQMRLIDTQGELERTWNQLVQIEAKLGESINYAFSPRFGFLTADPALCGTAMEATVYLQLPALIHSHSINDVLERYGSSQLSITGLQGSPTEIIGDIITIKNNYTIGLSEENILTTIRNVTTKLMLEENTTRNTINKTGDNEIKDRVSRAYGILTHSYQIEVVEALNALSLLKLGGEFGWISGMSTKEFNALFFNCRRAHLLNQFETPVPIEELPHKRADYIHQALENVSLSI